MFVSFSKENSYLNVKEAVTQKKSFNVFKLLLSLLLLFAPLESALAETGSAWTQTSQADFEAGEGVNIDTSSSPGDIQLPEAGDTGLSSIAAGLDHTVGLKNDGTVVAVGSNGRGQLNVGSWSDIKAVAAGAISLLVLKTTAL